MDTNELIEQVLNEGSYFAIPTIKKRNSYKWGSVLLVNVTFGDVKEGFVGSETQLEFSVPDISNVRSHSYEGSLDGVVFMWAEKQAYPWKCPVIKVQSKEEAIEKANKWRSASMAKWAA